MAAILEKVARSLQLSDEVARLAEQLRASVVVVRGSRFGGGSGVVWSQEGLVVTNHHVVPGERAEVVLSNGSRRAARVTARSESLDLAALQVEGNHPDDALPAALIGDSARLRAGELVMAVGNPGGERNAVTLGVVSGTGIARMFGKPIEAIQVSITLRPGNSGGALADAQGRVVGIPNMVINTGLALAVPSHVVERFLLESRRRGRFGIEGQYVELPATLAQRLGLSAHTGVLLMAIEPGSPAEQAGLTIGDIIVGLSEAEPGDHAGPLTRLSGGGAGQPARLKVIRAGELHWFEVTPR